MVLCKIARRRAIPNITLDIGETLTTFNTVSPVASLLGMFDHMSMAHRVTFVITGAAGTRIGERFILVVVVAHGTVAAFSEYEWALLATETTVCT
jgi:hypothetical protein